MRKALPFLLASTAWSCSVALDFNDESDLPCPCLPDYVCLQSTNRCVKKGSVEDFKSCSPDAVTPDDLCQDQRICHAINEQGPRCLPRCNPSNYATPEAGQNIANQCRAGTTCWPIPAGGGVCSEGVCSDLPNTCAPPQSCVLFNAAGVCFTPCHIFDANSCAGGQACHPVGNASQTACIAPGSRRIGEPCSDRDPCQQNQDGRPLVCDRPAASSDTRLCYPLCAFGSNAGCAPDENCQFSRPRIDPDTQRDLGLCVRI